MISDIALAGLAKSMDALKGSIESAFEFAQRAEKSSMALGMSFGQASDRLGGTMSGLRGDLNERFAGAIAGLEAGLQGNTAGIAKLINQQRLTGTASAKTAAAFAKMEMTMGLSRETTNQLASNMVDLGAEFQISTDNLVGAINMMAESFPAQKLAGMGAEVNEAVAGLQAELGPAMSGPLNNVMKMIMDTSMDGYSKLTQLGIGNVREQLAAAKSTEEAQMILKDAIGKAAGRFESVVGDASEGYFQIGVASEIFGKSAMDLVTIQDAFGQRTRQEADQAADFGNQLSVIKSEILIPLQSAFLEFFPIIKGVATVIAGALKQAIDLLVMKGVELFVRFGGLTGIVDKVKESFFNTLDKVKKFKNEALVGLGIAIAGITLKLTIMAISAVVPLITAFGGLLLAIFPISAPFIAIAAAVGGLVFLFTDFDKVVSTVKNALLDFVGFVGKVIVKISEYLPILGGVVGGLGESIQNAVKSLKGKEQELKPPGEGSPQEKNAEADRAAKEKAEQERKQKELMDQFQSLLEVDEKNLGLAEKRTKDTEEINRKTPEIATTPEFLDETANTLGRSIEGILGIGRDTTSEEMLEKLTEIAQSTTITAEKEGMEPAINTGS